MPCICDLNRRRPIWIEPEHLSGPSDRPRSDKLLIGSLEVVIIVGVVWAIWSMVQ